MADRNDTWEKIAAFADGELSAEECCTLLREAMAEPDRARCVDHQQQLRKLLSGCMDCQKTMRCPDELKRAVAGLADEHCGDRTAAAPVTETTPRPASPQRTGVLASIGSWVPLSAAAALFVAALILFFYPPQPPASQPGNPGGIADASPAGPVSAKLVKRVEQRHVRCASGAVTPFRSDLFPDDVDQLGDVVAQHLTPDVSAVPFDLSALGYDYRVAGLCNVPGRGAVHVVYASHEPDAFGRTQTMSLWIKPYDPENDPEIEAGVPAVGADESDAHPVIVWRNEALIYYFVGDAMPEVQKAQQHFAQAS